MSRYQTVFGEVSKKEPPRLKKGRKKPAVGQEAAEALDIEQTQQKRIDKAFLDEVAQFGEGMKRREELLTEMNASGLPMSYLNMRTLAAALYMLQEIKERLRVRGNMDREWLDYPPFHQYLTDQSVPEEEKEQLWNKTLANIAARVVVNVGVRREEIMAQHREGVIRYMALLANSRALKRLGITLSRTLDKASVDRILRSVEMSGVPLYILSPEALESLVLAMEKTGGNAELAKEDPAVDPAYYAMLPEMALYWLPGEKPTKKSRAKPAAKKPSPKKAAEASPKKAASPARAASPPRKEPGKAKGRSRASNKD